jgi:hypothetical protein
MVGLVAGKDKCSGDVAIGVAFENRPVDARQREAAGGAM